VNHNDAGTKERVVRPKQPFLDWLRAADLTSSELTLQELVLELADLLDPRMRHTSGGR
jgi:hypothetical protein